LSTEFADPTLRLSISHYETIVGHCYDALPDEACGLLAGPMLGGQTTGYVSAAYPCRNADASARTYTVEGKDYLRASRDAESRGDDIVGVWHSHTHTDAYPSVTDVRQAVDPAWIYVLVSLRDGAPVLRAYRIEGERVSEVSTVLEAR
jgi:proteasome lid subunit RPN8/RPN11